MRYVVASSSTFPSSRSSLLPHASPQQLERDQRERRQATTAAAAGTITERGLSTDAGRVGGGGGSGGSSSIVNRDPLLEGKDAAERPLPPVDGSSSSSSSSYRDASPVSYFPDQVAMISYLVAVLDGGDEYGRYLDDLKVGMDVLATELAPLFFPGDEVREVTASVNGWFPASEFR
jgi:hypothetical protein